MDKNTSIKVVFWLSLMGAIISTIIDFLAKHQIYIIS